MMGSPREAPLGGLGRASHSDPMFFNGLSEQMGSLGSYTANLIGKSLNFAVIRKSALWAVGLAVQLPRLPAQAVKMLKTLRSHWEAFQTGLPVIGATR